MRFLGETASRGYWQGIAGGGEGDESPLCAARREAMEEAGIGTQSTFVRLEAQCMLPVETRLRLRMGARGSGNSRVFVRC